MANLSETPPTQEAALSTLSTSANTSINVGTGIRTPTPPFLSQFIPPSLHAPIVGTVPTAHFNSVSSVPIYGTVPPAPPPTTFPTPSPYFKEIVTPTPTPRNSTDTKPPPYWLEFKDQKTNQTYYYNTETKVCVWDQPEDFRIQKARMQVEKLKQQTSVSKQKQQEEDHIRAVQAKKKFDSMEIAQRREAFTAFLKEHSISPEFRWQEALRHITKEGLDREPTWRFALKTVGEKKQLFAEYCTQSKSQSIIEKRRRVKRNREEFIELLHSIEFLILQLGSEGRDDFHSLTWNDFAQHEAIQYLHKDPRWEAIQEANEKRDLYEGYMLELTRKKQLERSQKRQELKQKIMQVLMDDTEAKQMFNGHRKRWNSEEKRQLFDIISKTIQIPKELKHLVFEWIDESYERLRDRILESKESERDEEKKLAREFRSWLLELFSAYKIARFDDWEAVDEKLVKIDRYKMFEVLSSRRKQRVHTKVIREERHRLRHEVAFVKSYLGNSPSKRNDGPGMNVEWDFKAFSDALTSRILTRASTRSVDESAEEAERKMELEALVLDQSKMCKEGQSVADSITFPAYVFEVFELLKLSAKKQLLKVDGSRRNGERRSGRRKDRSMNVCRARASSKRKHDKRRRSCSVQNECWSRRSRSKSARRRSRSRSVEPKKRSRKDMLSSEQEAAKAEEVIRQARAKLLFQKEETPVKTVLSDELEEGEVTD
uniref:Uncharacterized protein AlNc14C163G7832 n=1 Tax=Albugo laibachii Nc14 TaxID=890382 RepID=F0WMZ5_9STRA|nr:conserved hypothetical protein [Albugo laibachii Nc14]|eukprot:CCA22682.1 conserved hypothetical protein [Albugo laibachii Nc14]